MKKHNNRIGLVILLAGLPFCSTAQEVLTKADAVSIAMENNFDIQAAKNNVEVAKNNAEITNSGFLPTVSGNLGTSYSINDSESSLANGDVQTFPSQKTNSYNAGLNIDYSVFEGFGRKYNYAKLKENYDLSDLQARGVVENTLFNLFNSYYEIARLTQNEINQRQTLGISRERLLRAQYSFDYGQNTQLDVLNAEVDYNNDSIAYLTIAQQLDTEKHNLNLLLGRDVNTTFAVDTALYFADDLDFQTLAENAQQKNVALLQQQANVRNATYDVKIADSSIIPRIGLNSGYSWQKSENAQANFFGQKGSSSTGLTIGATLSWNIWDGGLSNTRRQNSKIAFENQQIIEKQTKLNLERDMSNAWTTYQTALFVMKAEGKNLETNFRNFDRTQEQYSLGQITSIEFRQAQLNLINAQLNFSQAGYSAKIAELALLQLSGDILNAQF